MDKDEHNDLLIELETANEIELLFDKSFFIGLQLLVLQSS